MQQMTTTFVTKLSTTTATTNTITIAVILKVK